jgi:hypothetical protein
VAERFCVSSGAIAETIEGEVIIIHLGTGAYYSLREAGADIWAEIERRASREEILGSLERRYEGSHDKMESHAQRLLEELQAEGLVTSVSAEEPLGPSPIDRDRRGPFVPPLLEKHTDMQDLILIDPVHEVEARGWPHAAEA